MFCSFMMYVKIRFGFEDQSVLVLGLLIYAVSHMHKRFTTHLRSKIHYSLYLGTLFSAFDAYPKFGLKLNSMYGSYPYIDRLRS